MQTYYTHIYPLHVFSVVFQWFVIRWLILLAFCKCGNEHVFAILCLFVASLLKYIYTWSFIFYHRASFQEKCLLLHFEHSSYASNFLFLRTLQAIFYCHYATSKKLSFFCFFFFHFTETTLLKSEKESFLACGVTKKPFCFCALFASKTYYTSSKLKAVFTKYGMTKFISSFKVHDELMKTWIKKK